MREQLDPLHHLQRVRFPLYHRPECVLDLKRIAADRVFGASLQVDEAVHQLFARVTDCGDLGAAEHVAAQHEAVLLQILHFLRVETPAVVHFEFSSDCPIVGACRIGKPPKTPRPRWAPTPTAISSRFRTSTIRSHSINGSATMSRSTGAAA